MVIEIKEITPENVGKVLDKFNKARKKTIASHFGKLKRGLDGMTYQKNLRNEWN